MSGALPSEQKRLSDLARGSKDPVSAFRTYVKLMDIAYKEYDTLKREVRKSDKQYTQLRDDIAYFERHKFKVDAAFRAMRETYRNPSKALKDLELLCRQYPAQHVYELCQQGSHRLGSAKGWNVLGIKSIERADADENYNDHVLRALSQLLPDHGDYLRLRDEGIEASYEEVKESLDELRSSISAIEAHLPMWTQEMTNIAKKMGREEILQLNDNEREVRSHLMLQEEEAPATTDDSSSLEELG